MTVVGIAMNLILAGLLLAAMMVGIRLNRRLGALRDSHDGFEAAVRDLNLAARVPSRDWPTCARPPMRPPIRSLTASRGVAPWLPGLSVC